MDKTSDKNTEGGDTPPEESQDTNARKRPEHSTLADLFEHQREFATQFFAAQDFITRTTQAPALDIATKIYKQIADHTLPTSNLIESLGLSKSISEMFPLATNPFSQMATGAYSEIFKTIYPQDNWPSIIGNSISQGLGRQFNQISDQLERQNQVRLNEIAAGFNWETLARIGNIVNLSSPPIDLASCYTRTSFVYEAISPNLPVIPLSQKAKKRGKSSSTKDTDHATARRWQTVCKMRKRLSMEDLEIICYTAKIPFDDLERGGITAMICRAIDYATRRRRLKQFVTAYNLFIRTD